MLTTIPIADDAPAEPSEKSDGQARQYIDYAHALAAMINGNSEEARRNCESVLKLRNAGKLGPADQNVLEIWSLEDMTLLPRMNANLSRN